MGLAEREDEVVESDAVLSLREGTGIRDRGILVSEVGVCCGVGRWLCGEKASALASGSEGRSAVTSLIVEFAGVGAAGGADTDCWGAAAAAAASKSGMPKPGVATSCSPTTSPKNSFRPGDFSLVGEATFFLVTDFPASAPGFAPFASELFVRAVRALAGDAGPG